MGIVVVTLTPALTRLFPGCPGKLEVDAASVGALLDELDTRWPGMRDRLCDSTPRLRRHVNIFVAGERSTLQTSLKSGAAVFVVTAISGG